MNAGDLVRSKKDGRIGLLTCTPCPGAAFVSVKFNSGFLHQRIWKVLVTNVEVISGSR